MEAVQRVTAVPTILRVITEITGLRLSMVAEVTEERWLCCAVNDQLGFGLEARGELDIDTTLCKEVRAAQRPIMMSHASADPRYCAHPTPKLYKFESYISVPIFRRDRTYFGNLCALDAKPLDLSAKTLAMFELFAELIGIQLDVEAHHKLTSDALLGERETAELREQFIAMLGHDLRSPLSAITLGAQVLAARQDEASARVVARISRSATKMTEMVDDLLDFARGRLGGGVPLALAEVRDFDALLRFVVDELRPQALVDIVYEAAPQRPLRCDRSRISQAVSNLVSNAMHHGDNREPIRIWTRWTDDTVQIAVTNTGPEIPGDRIATIFEPYRRAVADETRDGLGLGLYIVSEVARAHRGGVACTSERGRTTFTLTLPLDPDARRA